MLCRLERHEISLDEYLDYTAEQAVQHLKGKVGAARLKDIQVVIREHMTADPAVVHYLRQATGLDVDANKAT